MNKLAVIITSPPSSNLSVTAIEYIEAALALQIEIVGIFFYQDGVLHANTFVEVPTDEYQAQAKWLALKNEFNLSLHLCVTAASKRGLQVDETNSVEPQSSNVADAFEISGLGELVELTNYADRVIQF
ncbi:sulfurtransferase complex subunit TusD [Litorilituus lipolyticus]|uniref:Sulfurtransferase complex subunit TusD n=1 Tax=Litorilituus lipolyticus TaxID=2491017 RepID=A0A502KX18_9GAMM|nr:sulfurtransferase complex subunit TusD [Litorilituus lipolyticus]TPH12777.1 sulfurtransferase complex subunit TusD [Litorilituus lipolyticus]